MKQTAEPWERGAIVKAKGPVWVRGRIVQSLAGRDKGYLLCVVGYDNEFVLVCDGKERKLERPKKKKPKHVQAVDCEAFTWQLRGNHALRKALNQLKENGVQAEQQDGLPAEQKEGELKCQKQI